ncbi:MAG TPA: serine/threonine-protein kinase [Actinomycetales bacterium]
MDSATTDRLIGSRYRLESVLGRGGMGVVWAAHDLVLGRPVAVKEVLPVPGLSPEELAVVRRRTLDEARNAARLASGASVLVYDVVEEDGEPWIVMERLAPRTLDDVLRERGPLPTHEVAQLGLSLLDALDAAHAVGVLHRDVKPSNVMFRGEDRTDHAVLTDFGVARFVGDPSVTMTGTLIGSPAFVSPERAGGAAASPASDLWALGVTLWIAAEGVSPFHRAGTLETLSAVLTADPPRPQLAGPLAPLLTGLLHKDPDQRLTAAQARHALERIHGPRANRPEHVAVTDPVDRAAPLQPAVPLTAAAPVTAPAAPAAPPGDTRSPRGRGRLAAALAVTAVALAAVGVVAGSQLLDDGASRDAAAPTRATSGASAPADGPAAPSAATTPGAAGGGAPAPAPSTDAQPLPSPTDPSTGATTEPDVTPSATGSASAGASRDAGADGAVAAGMRRYSDRTGFSVVVPSDWQTERRGSRVYLRDPGSPAYLLVDQTDDPASDPVADWEQQERRVSKRLKGYRLIRIDPLQIGAWRGADWEFTHGAGTHVLNRNLVTGPEQAYALYWSAPDSSWSQSLEQFEQVTRTFEPSD